MKANILKSAPVVLFLFPLLLQSCKKDKAIQPQPTLLGTISLTQDELMSVPYTTSQILIFEDSLGGSVSLAINNRISYYPRYYKNGGTDNRTDYYDIEHNRITFSGSNNLNGSIEISAPLPAYVSNTHPGKMSMTFYFGIRDLYTSDFSSYSLLDSLGFYHHTDESPMAFYNSLFIVQTAHSDVYELKRTGGASGGEYITWVYYSFAEGLVGFKTNFGKTWGLKP